MKLRAMIRTAIKPDEAAELARLATGRTVLEVGAQRGFSTALMARGATVVHSVDWHRGDAIVGYGDTLPVIWSNLTRLGLLDKVVLHVGRTEQVLPHLAGPFDFAFHDADHTTEAVLADVALMAPLLAPGSLLAFHDYGRYGVAAAVDSLGWERVSLTRALVVIRVPAMAAAA